MFLGQVDAELVQDLSGVAVEGAEQRPVAVHHDEAEPGGRRERERETYLSFVLVFGVFHVRPYLLSSASKAVRASVWNLLSQR